MKRVHFLSVAVSIFFSFLVGCSPTTDDLTAKATPTIVESPENYQTVYRRLSKQFDCVDGAWAGTFASIQVDRELYTELEYGEIALRMSNAGTNNYYSYLKISKAGSGSRVEIYTGNTLAKENDAQLLAEIASGKREPSCG